MPESVNIQSTKPQPKSEVKSGGCACGHEDTAVPVIDVRVIPHAVRHGSIFGALNTLAVGDALELVVDHEPIPLLNQLDQLNPGMFEHEFLQRGEVVRLRLTRLLP